MHEVSTILSALMAGGPYGLAVLFAAATIYLFRAREKDRQEYTAEIRDLNEQLISTMSSVTTALIETRNTCSRVELYLQSRRDS